MIPSKKRKDAGFTLLELMVALVVSSIVLVGAFDFFSSMEKSYTVQEQISETQQNARVSHELMTRELRMAGYGVNSGEIITEADDDAVTFKGDIDDNGAVETVRYALDAVGLQLTREVDGGGAQPVAENIPNTGLVLTYYDSAGTAVSPLPLNAVSRRGVRRINISITARTAYSDLDYSPNGGFRTTTLSSDIKPRNIDLFNKGCSVPAAPSINGSTSTGLNGTYPCQLHVEWSAVTTDVNGDALGADCPLIQYKVHYGTSSGSYEFTQEIPPDDTDATFTVAPACTYYIKVSAESSAGEGGWSSEYPITDATNPGVPASLIATPYDYEIELTWDIPTTNNCDIAGYEIYRGPSSGSYSLLVTTADPGTTFRDTVTNCATYYYAVKAVDQCGLTSGLSNETFATAGSSPPRNPIYLGAVSVSSEVELTWGAPVNNEDATDFIEGDPTHYNIYRSTDENGPWSLVSSVISPTTTYTDNPALPYYYMVRAVDVCGNESTDSNVAAPPSLTVTFEPGYPDKSSGQRKIRVEAKVVDEYLVPVTDATLTVSVAGHGAHTTPEYGTLSHNAEGVYGDGSIHGNAYWEGSTGYDRTEDVTVTVTAERDGYTNTVQATFN